MDLTVHTDLTYAAGDKLCVLRPEIDYQQTLIMDVMQCSQLTG